MNWFLNFDFGNFHDFFLQKANKIVITGTTFKVSGLENGLEYEFRVYAQNLAGISPASKVSDTVMCRDPVDAPTQPEVLQVGRKYVTIEWKKPNYDGGSTLVGYNIEKCELPSDKWFKCNFSNVAETYFKADGLTENAKYQFRVIAKNAIGKFCYIHYLRNIQYNSIFNKFRYFL